MNFIYPSFKLLFFFFLIKFVCFPVQSQDTQDFNFSITPVSCDLPLPSKITEQGISDVKFDEKGFLYITSSPNIWIYNGNIWQQVYAGSDPKVTISGQGDILVFSGNKFYKLLLNERSQYHLSETNIIIPHGEKMRSAEFLGDELIIATELNVYGYDDSGLKPIQSLTPGSNIFFGDSSLFIWNETGLMILRDDLSIEQYPGIPGKINAMEDTEYGLWLLTGDRKKLSLFDPKLQAVLSEKLFSKEISDFIVVNNNELYLLFKDNSIVMLDPETQESPFKELGYQDDNYNILLSIQGRIWITGRKKIKILDYVSGTFTIDDGPINHPEDFTYVNDQLYLLYRNTIYDNKGQNIFYSEEDVENIFSIAKKLFIDRESDILEFDPETGNYNIHKLDADYADCRDSSYFLFQSVDSIFVFHYSEDGKWVRIVSQQNDGSEYCIFSSSLCAVNNGILAMTNLQNKEKEFYKLPEIFSGEYPVKLLPAGENLWLYNYRHIYIFKPSNKFYKEERPLLSDDLRIEKLIKLNKNYILIKLRSYNNPGSFILLDTFSGKSRYFNIQGLPAYFSKFQVEDISENYFILGSETGLYLINKDVKQRALEQFFPVIIQVIYDEDTLTGGQYFGTRRDKIENIPTDVFSTGKSLKIEFSGTHYLYPISFSQYKLDEDADWAEWKNSNVIVLKNLSPGNHQLFLRLMNSQGEVSGQTAFDFSIPRPYLLRVPVLLALVLIILIIVFIMYKRLKLYILKTRTDEPEVKAYYRKEMEGARIPGAESTQKVIKREREKEDRWDKYEMVTVLFSDIQGFTKIAEQMNPENLIDELDRFFFHFDSVVEKYNIEKIKTIGDAYMAAGGIPLKNRSNPVEVILAALEMQQYMQNLQKTKVDFWDLRIGIHTGPVIAGVVGHKKRSYDIWGDTVNTASRMESSGVAGKVNISGETYFLVKEYFMCEYRGKLPVKYKGNLDMYFVQGLRPELSINLAGIPNRKFFLKLHLLRLLDLEEHVFKKLEEESPAFHYFHTPDYAHHLYSYSELLSKAENLDMEERLLINASVLLLITGFIENYQNPEIEASRISLEILKDFHFSENQIQNISNLILASKCPPEPKTLLEKIMVDIRYEYLGRADYVELYVKLYQEQKAYNKDLNFKNWKEEQIKLLESHRFYTSGARRLSEIPFSEQVKRLIQEEQE